MLLRFIQRKLPRALVSGAALLALSIPLARGQGFYPQAGMGMLPGAGATTPQTPQVPPTPPTTPPPSEGITPPAATPESAAAAPPSVAPESGLALGGGTFAAGDSAVGYIDTAIPRTRLRLRYDAAFDDNVPDRAEFFYAKCGCFADLPPTNPNFDPNAPGPHTIPQRVDYQEVTSYLEVALDRRFSAFVEIPVRFVDFDDRLDPNVDVHSNQAGLSDINAGFKYALIACDDQYFTFQLRTFTPTGEASRGLGTDHVSLEPAFLLYQRLTDRLLLEGEVRDWIPIGGTDFAGNVIRYGIGFGYEVHKTECLRIIPVTELVGWTVLGGKEFDPNRDFVAVAINGQPPPSAAGDTIVNAKVGVRTYFGDHSDVYVGYGRALTGDVWYKDIVRVEYRLSF